MMLRNMSYSESDGSKYYMNYYRCELIRCCDDQRCIATKLLQIFKQIPRLINYSGNKITLPINASRILSFVPDARPCTSYVYKNKEFSDR